MSTNVMMRDLDVLGPHAAMDGRRLKVIADGLPLFDGAQLALETTMVSPLHRDGTAKRGQEDAHVWLSWQPKSAGGGQTRLRNSLKPLPSTAPRELQVSWVSGCSPRG